MHYAFIQAGARSVVASLFAVHDAKTAELMDTFYQAAFGKQRPGRLQALREAQLALRKAHPDDPHLWAAFVLFGDPGSQDARRSEDVATPIRTLRQSLEVNPSDNPRQSDDVAALLRALRQDLGVNPSDNQNDEETGYSELSDLCTHGEEEYSELSGKITYGDEEYSKQCEFITHDTTSNIRNKPTILKFALTLAVVISLLLLEIARAFL